ncbi:MAG TPA: response regulator [Nitrospirota bacterium]|nr:response regulator [Nitrospirota bacterium]
MGKNVMVVDDCRTTRKIVSLYLNNAGYKTIGAGNGVEAIEKLVSSEVDIIISDLNMPQMDGAGLVEWVRSNPSYREIPFIILTTENDVLRKSDLIQKGASAFLSKPITKENLVEEVTRILERCNYVRFQD